MWNNVFQTQEDRDKNIDLLVASIRQQLQTGIFITPGLNLENATRNIEMLEAIKREDVTGQISVYPDGTLALAEMQAGYN
jgi:hypothetical protein